MLSKVTEQGESGQARGAEASVAQDAECDPSLFLTGLSYHAAFVAPSASTCPNHACCRSLGHCGGHGENGVLADDVCEEC